MMFLILLKILFFISVRQNILAQCVPSSPSTFGLPGSICPDEALSFTNPYIGSGVSYEWDFCTEDMKVQPSLSISLAMIFGANSSVHTQIVNDNGIYYLFVLSRNNSTLFRLDLGNNPKNAPNAVNNLGVITGGNFAEPIVIVKDGNNWYGFTCNTNSNNNFIKINFGSSITNQPTYTFWGNISAVMSSTRAFDIFKEGNNFYLAALGVSNNKLVIIDLGANLAGNLLASNIVREDTFSNISTPLCLRARKDCNGWNIIAASENNRNFIFTFNSGIANPPLSNTYFLPAGYSGNYAMDVLEENGKYYILNVDVSGRTHLFDFGNNLSGTPTANFFNIISPEPSFNQVFGISGIKHATGSSFFLVSLNNRVFRMDFERNCGANSNISTQTNPINISYRNVGNHPVVLNVKNGSGDLIQRYEGNANISPTATVGNFTAQNTCLGNAITFNNTSVGADSLVASWLWNFGDSNTSNLKNPTHTYTAAGTYNVTLTVNNLDACTNHITKQILISAGVQADFQEISTACVGQSIIYKIFLLLLLFLLMKLKGFIGILAMVHFLPSEIQQKLIQQQAATPSVLP